MKKFYTLILTVISLCSYQITDAQCNGVKGPNLLGAKGSFSAPFITVNAAAESCTSDGANSYNPIGNIGNALNGCTNPGSGVPCSDFVYTAAIGGLEPEVRYSILKTIGDNSGNNCIKGDWIGKDHTGDGGYFMAVNGTPSNTFSPVFYQVKSIPVCVGATYEFSAWVINLLPASSNYAIPGSEPKISFKVNGDVIANSGPIEYNNTGTWVKVSGSFVATTNTVDLEVANATSTATGNDFGLDDVSINVCQSQIVVEGPISNCGGNIGSVNYTVTDNSQANTWYKWQKSIDGGNTFTDITNGAQASFVGNSYTLINELGILNGSMNGTRYRLAVSTSQSGLSNPACVFFNDYTLVVAECGPLPVQLTSFTGRYSNGKALLDWQTSQELNSDRFEIYRSTNAADFVKIASVKGAGNSNLVKNYAYQDDISSASGKYVYYRLKQIDIDGKATFSSVVRLSVGNTKASFDIFPNPFTNNFTVSFGASKTATATLRIQNGAGNLVFAKTISVTKGSNSVILNNLPTLSAGIYYVTIFNEELNINGKLQKL